MADADLIAVQQASQTQSQPCEQYSIGSLTDGRQALYGQQGSLDIC